ncbi:MAG: hypothetical protein JOZ86_13780 [Candidatus Eremiobacteraeota bacterium]|nr:hypothetical protein [Candidatus Eremiobacteraeota bacterium]
MINRATHRRQLIAQVRIDPARIAHRKDTQPALAPNRNARPQPRIGQISRGTDRLNPASLVPQPNRRLRHERSDDSRRNNNNADQLDPNRERGEYAHRAPSRGKALSILIGGPGTEF